MDTESAGAGVMIEGLETEVKKLFFWEFLKLKKKFGEFFIIIIVLAIGNVWVEMFIAGCRGRNFVDDSNLAGN